MPKPNAKLKVVIILPTYNEIESIQSLIENLQEIFSRQKNYDFFVLVVDDDSPDKTAQKVKTLQEKYKNINLLTGQKKGLGVAYIRGMQYAIKNLGADIVFQMDADLSHNPQLIPDFLNKIQKGADFVIGARYIKGGSIPDNWGFDRKMFSVFGNLIVRFGLMIPRIHDWSSGYRGIKSEVFNSVSDGLDKYIGYTFQIAFLHRAINSGYKIAEVPLKFVDRKYGQSKFIPLDYITNVLLYIFFNSSFIKFGLVGITGFIINVIGLETFYRLGLHPGIAAAIGAEFAIISNFILNNFWSFSHKSIKKGEGVRKKFLQFNFVSIGAVVIQALTVGLGTHFFGNGSRFIFLVIAVICFVIPYSYFVYNRFIWKI